MATIKAVILKEKIKADGTVPIYIRISEGTRNKYITVERSVLEVDWDKAEQKVKKSNANYDLINGVIRKKKAEAERSVLEMMLADSEKDILNSIKRKKEKKVRSSFFLLAEEYLKDLYLNKKFTRFSAEKSRVKASELFLITRIFSLIKLMPHCLKSSQSIFAAKG